MFSLARKHSRLFSTLLLAESRAGALHPANLTALAAAQKLGLPIDVLVLDCEVKSVSVQADGVRDVFAASHEAFRHPTAESYSHAVSAFIKSQNKYTHVVSAASTFSKDYFPRLAALHGCQPLSEVVEVLDQTTFKRPTYAGSAIATVRSSSPIHFLNTRPTSFDPVASVTAAVVKPVDGAALLAGLPANVAKWVSEQIKKSERPDLAQAKIVVAGGRGRLSSRSDEERRQLRAAGPAGQRARRLRDRRIESRGRRRLLSERHAGRTDRQSRRSAAVLRGGHIRSDPARGGHERLESHRRNQKSQRKAARYPKQECDKRGFAQIGPECWNGQRNQRQREQYPGKNYKTH